MEQRPFGRTGFSVGALGLGAAEAGYAGDSAASVGRLLDAALEQGANVVDTAECYGNSEETLGRALKGRRERVLLFSKCGHSHGYGDPDWDDVSRLEKSLERSLERLGTDRLDLFQLHSCPLSSLERGEVVEFMKKAKRAGKTRLIGYSGDGEAALFAVKSGAFDALQISVNVADQEAIDLVLPEAQKRGLGVIAKRPIANAAWRHETRPDNAYHAPYWQRLKALGYPFLREPDAAAKALRFTLSSPGVCTAIVGTQKPERLAENARAAALGPLPKKEYEAIRARWKQVREAGWVGQT
jgi:aryl-alcohol dehydrogenase-like predicted oxidoreductase